jgi:hypothetical protein
VGFELGIIGIWEVYGLFSIFYEIACSAAGKYGLVLYSL